MELAIFPLTAREVVQLSDTDRNKIQLSVLIPLTVGEWFNAECSGILWQLDFAYTSEKTHHVYRA